MPPCAGSHPGPGTCEAEHTNHLSRTARTARRPCSAPLTHARRAPRGKPFHGGFRDCGNLHPEPVQRAPVGQLLRADR
ncbi:MAG TPA: hypothetical protein DEV75_05330, partial [Desulfovibrio sp.]|nr:hypothetical protein [Desulfovibrio sp.]